MDSFEFVCVTSAVSHFVLKANVLLPAGGAERWLTSDLVGMPTQRMELTSENRAAEAILVKGNKREAAPIHHLFMIFTFHCLPIHCLRLQATNFAKGTNSADLYWYNRLEKDTDKLIIKLGSLTRFFKAYICSSCLLPPLLGHKGESEPQLESLCENATHCHGNTTGSYPGNHRRHGDCITRCVPRAGGGTSSTFIHAVFTLLSSLRTRPQTHIYSHHFIFHIHHLLAWDEIVMILEI